MTDRTVTVPGDLVLAIDPDPNGGSWVVVGVDGHLGPHGRNVSRSELREAIEVNGPGVVVVEGIQSYGMPVGVSVFETVKVIGELRYFTRNVCVYIDFDDTLTRPQIKSALCRSSRATDANVRAALIDLYPPTGGGKTPQIGIKAKPGPLYGLAKDEWQALAVGIVWMGLRGLGPMAERDSV